MFAPNVKAYECGILFLIIFFLHLLIMINNEIYFLFKKHSRYSVFAPNVKAEKDMGRCILELLKRSGCLVPDAMQIGVTKVSRHSHMRVYMQTRT